MSNNPHRKDLSFYFIIPKFGIDFATIYAIFTEETIPVVSWSKIVCWDLLPLTEWFPEQSEGYKFITSQCKTDGVYCVDCNVSLPEYHKDDYRFWKITPLKCYQARLHYWTPL
jgi:hypothetical protein